MSNVDYSKLNKYGLILAAAERFGIALDKDGYVVGRGSTKECWDPTRNARDLKELLLRIGASELDKLVLHGRSYSEVLVKLLGCKNRKQVEVYSYRLDREVVVDWESARGSGVNVEVGDDLVVWIEDWYSDLFTRDVSGCIEGVGDVVSNAWMTGGLVHVVGLGLGRVVHKVLEDGFFARQTVSADVSARAYKYIIQISFDKMQRSFPNGQQRAVEVDDGGYEILSISADRSVEVSDNRIVFASDTTEEDGFQIFYGENALYSSLGYASGDEADE